MSDERWLGVGQRTKFWIWKKLAWKERPGEKLMLPTTLLTLTRPSRRQPSVFCSCILSTHPSSTHCSIPLGLSKDQPLRTYACRTSSQELQHPDSGGEAP